jgi:hypothetical protein
MLRVYPQGHGSNSLSGEQLSVGFSFTPTATSTSASISGDRISPNYAEISVAATDGWAWGTRISLSASVLDPVKVLRDTLVEAVRVVTEEKRCAVIECLLDAL